MSVSDIVNRFNDSLEDNNLTCTKKALEEFIVCGLVVPTGKGYKTRQNVPLNVEFIKEKVVNFDINLSEIIQQCEQISKENKIKRIYCMSQRCYNEYKDNGYIITKNDKNYFRIFEKELWLVNIIDV